MWWIIANKAETRQGRWRDEDTGKAAREREGERSEETETSVDAPTPPITCTARWSNARAREKEVGGPRAD